MKKNEQWQNEKKKRLEHKTIKEELDRCYKKLEDVQLQGNYEEASKLKYVSIPNLEKKIKRNEIRSINSTRFCHRFRYS